MRTLPVNQSVGPVIEGDVVEAILFLAFEQAAWMPSLLTIISEAAFRRTTSTFAPVRRYFSITIFSACTLEMPQIWAMETSFTARSGASRKTDRHVRPMARH